VGGPNSVTLGQKVKPGSGEARVPHNTVRVAKTGDVPGNQSDERQTERLFSGTNSPAGAFSYRGNHAPEE